MIAFGREFRRKHFDSLSADVANLNHGSCGLPPTVIQDAQLRAIQKSLAFPDKYMRVDSFEHIERSRQVMADILDSELENMVLVQNASNAFNAVVRSYPFKRGDKVIYFSLTYKACVNTLEFLKRDRGIETVCIDVDLPTTHKAIVASVKETLAKHPETKMLVMDLVSNMPSVYMPYERIVEVCRERGVLSFVDAAHGIGLVPISLRTVRPDFFTTNSHKWMYGVHSAAAFYAEPAHHSWLVSMPISLIHFPSDQPVSDRFARSFSYVGSTDYTAQETLVGLAEFHERECGGLDQVMAYQNELSKQASEMVCQELRVSEIADFGPEFRCAMFTVNLPIDVPEAQHQECMAFFFDILFSRKVYLPLVSYRGRLYTRFSATIYLELNDFRTAIAALKECIRQWNVGHKIACTDRPRPRL